MLNMYVSKNKEIAYRVIEDEAIILTPEDGMLHNLNPVATVIFESANGKRQVKDIIGKICEEFDIEERVAHRDCLNFIEDLVHKKMLILSGKPTKFSK